MKRKGQDESDHRKGQEETKSESGLPRWRKIGGGNYRMANGRIIKTNQVFRAAESDLPKAFRHLLVPLDGLPKDTPLDVSSGKYEVRAAGTGWYDVIDTQGKVVNEKSLRQADAEKLIQDLSG